MRDEFEHVALSHLSRLYSAAFYLTKDKNEAEDLLQETYLRAFRFFDKFQLGTNCEAWLLSILRHLFINRYRQRKREPETTDWEEIDRAYESVGQAAGVEENNPERFFFTKLLGDEIKKALKGLEKRLRIAMLLVVVEGLSYREAAVVMGCPIGTVRSRVSRGRRMLQATLRHCAMERS